LIQLGAYVSGSNSKLDSSIRAHERILSFLRQGPRERSEFPATLNALAELAAAL
jgi:flagellum-specific ATP synthase